MSGAAAADAAPRRVAVIGAGAVGTLLGGLLASAGADVTLVDLRVPADASQVVTLHRPDGGTVRARVHRAARLADLPERPALVVLAVKMFDLEAALDDLAALPGVTVLTIQNGIGAEERVASARPAAPLVAGSLTAPVERPAPAEVRWRGRGGIALAVAAGDVSGGAEAAAWLAGVFERAGLPARVLPDARAMKWSKLLANLVGNALSALADCDPALVYADPVLFNLERRQLLEVLAVMRAGRIPVVALPGADVRLLARAVRLPAPLARAALGRVVGGARGGKSPSLRLHLRSASGPTEAAWMSGAVARLGALLGVPTPVNAALAELLDRVVREPDLRAELVNAPHRIAEIAGMPAGSTTPVAPRMEDR